MANGDRSNATNSHKISMQRPQEFGNDVSNQIYENSIGKNATGYQAQKSNTDFHQRHQSRVSLVGLSQESTGQYSQNLMQNQFSTNQMIQNLTHVRNNEESGGSLQNQLKQKISEARNKINSKRQSGINTNTNSDLNIHASTTNLLKSSQNMLSTARLSLSKSPCKQAQVSSQNQNTQQIQPVKIQQNPLQLQKSQSQINGFDLFKKSLKQKTSLSPFEANKDFGLNSSQLSPFQKKLNQFDFNSTHQLNPQKSNLTSEYSSNQYVTQNHKIDTQDTSLDSLMQICNILPDSNRNTRKDQLLKEKNYQSRSGFQTHRQETKNEARNSLAKNESQPTLRHNQKTEGVSKDAQNKILLQSYLSNRETLTQGHTNRQSNSNSLFDIKKVAENRQSKIFKENQTQENKRGSFLNNENQKIEKIEAPQYFSTYNLHSEYQSMPFKNISNNYMNENEDLQEKFQQSIHYQITEKALPIEIIKDDLKSHLDEFLKQNRPSLEMMSTQNLKQTNSQINNAVIFSPSQTYDMFTSFASPNQNQGILTMSDVQGINDGNSSVNQRNSVLKETQTDKDNDEQSISKFQMGVVQSPTPKFSLNVDRSLNNPIFIENHKTTTAQAARQMQINEKIKTQLGYETGLKDAREINIEIQKLDSVETLKRVDNFFFPNSSRYNENSHQQNKLQLVPSKTFDLHNDNFIQVQSTQANQNAKPFSRHLKSNSKPNLHFMSKLQYKSPLFQTQTDDRVVNDIFGADSIRNRNMDQDIMESNCFQTCSERGQSKDKNNVLSRTASMDHYLSNATTFLRGQRFLSPTSKQDLESQIGNFKTKEQIKSYFVKLLFKKFQKSNNTNIKEAYYMLRHTKQNLRLAKLEKVGILNLVREFVMKTDALNRWKKLRMKEVFKIKGFATQKMIEALTSVAYNIPFKQMQKTDNFKQVLNPLIAERIHLFTKKWCQLHAWQTWFRRHKYKEYIKKRTQIVQRVLVNVMRKKQLVEAFNDIKLSRLRKSSFNSLNFKIIQLLNKMSEDSNLIRMKTQDKLQGTILQTPTHSQSAQFIYNAQNTSDSTLTPPQTNLLSSHTSHHQTLSDIIQPSKLKILKTLAAHQLMQTIKQLKNSRTKDLFLMFKQFKHMQTYQLDQNQRDNQSNIQNQKLQRQLLLQRQKILAIGLRSLNKIVEKYNHKVQREIIQKMRREVKQRCGAIRVLVN
eukprot:403363460